MKDILFISCLAVLVLPVHGIHLRNGTFPSGPGRTVCSTQNCPQDAPCAVLDCAPGFFCLESPGGPICQEGRPPSCASTTCIPPLVCVDTPTGAECRPSTIRTCALMFCPPGTRCVDLPTGGVCKTVSTKPGTCPKTRPRSLRWGRRLRCQRPCETDDSCPGNQKCCISEGCGYTCRSPVTSTTCTGMKCPRGQVCKLQSVVCKRPPCPKRPKCVPDAPSECPLFACIAIFPPPPCKVDECKTDRDCPGSSNKCCFRCGCGYCLQTVEPPPPSPPSCANVRCGSGLVCKLQPVPCLRKPCFSRPVCVPREKPGVCPAPLPGSAGICGRLCKSDSDCKDDDKCCRTVCGGATCVDPDPCANVVCRPGHECKKTSTGTACLPVEKPGKCPQYRCPDRKCEAREECTSDEECAGANKCCKTCTGCRRCMCDSARCGPGEECRRVPSSKRCEAFPWLCPEPVNLCTFTAIQEPQCPTARPSSSSTCRDQCRTHDQCSEGQMCCDTACGASVCTNTVLPSTCDTESTCESRDLTCREVFNITGVFPRCLQHPPKTSFDDLCKVHLPLLIERQGSGGQVRVASCNAERDKITCPAGYSCRTRFGGGVSACCRDAPQPCDPPCGQGEKCETQPIFCFTRPCPPTPRCVRDGDSR